MRKLSLVLLSMLCTSVVLAEPPAATPSKTQEAASALVNKQVVQVLKKREAKRSRFSRASPAPQARRVRMLDAVAQADSHGKQFVRFAIDVRHRRAENGEWELEAFLGCVYVDQREIFLQQGADYLPASSVLNGDGEAQPDVCRPAPEGEAQVAAAGG